MQLSEQMGIKGPDSHSIFDHINFFKLFFCIVELYALSDFLLCF